MTTCSRSLRPARRAPRRPVVEPTARLAFFGLLAVLGAGCANAPAPVEPHHVPVTDEADAAAGAPVWTGCGEPAGPAVVTRADLTAFLDRGLPELLGRVRTAPVVDGEGPDARFVGFRLVGLDPDLRCGPLGLREGDVVSSVNGRSIERPDEALEIWNSLAEATEIRVTLIRGGIESEAVVRVEDAPVRIDNHGVSPAAP